MPKRNLVAIMQVLMQQRRLKVAGALQTGPIFIKELENFRYKLTTAANDTYSAWRENVHDDLVLSVAIGCWAGNRGLTNIPRKYDIQVWK